MLQQSWGKQDAEGHKIMNMKLYSEARRDSIQKSADGKRNHLRPPGIYPIWSEDLAKEAS